ncbi:hypothetical protein ACHRVW_17390 [Flavobacterium collinsii]|uniref:Lipoprotein n=1 Tax=Flavobacterium collinsii TaxID=1114861 RepID=A0ABM8KL09_9FLAO|nr:hypothetical protein [Flavobacterium collinsii]GIQ60117.1 hypothetical protein Flavo103_32530 [Flavobacterium collinsii]CAA9199605.1 hypothetical protein FLACOL7796_02809 [Flavobacterium collinsii]
MKKYASLLFFALLLNGCDDGDLTVDTIDFSDPTITAQTCNEKTNGLIYKLKKQESLMIQFPDNTLLNDATLAGKPLYYDINNTTTRVVYRAYNGLVGTANICGAIPPTTPGVTEEWQATAGKIVDITTAAVTDNADGSSTITGYNHNLVFQNITFLKPSGPQVEAEYPFGLFKTSYNSPSTLFTGPLKQCPGNKTLVYNQTASTALTIDNIDPLLLKNEVTTQPRIGLISTTTNKVLIRTFGIDGSLPPGYFCTSPLPSTPTVKETWIAGNSVQNVNGTIEVTTKLVGTAYFHTIVLKGVKFERGNSSFKLPNEYTFGVLEISTTP